MCVDEFHFLIGHIEIYPSRGTSGSDRVQYGPYDRAESTTQTENALLAFSFFLLPLYLFFFFGIFSTSAFFLFVGQSL